MAQRNETVQCVDCSTSADGYACSPCEVILVDNSNAYAESLRSESLREQENEFLARYGEPEIHL